MSRNEKRPGQRLKKPLPTPEPPPPEQEPPLAPINTRTPTDRAVVDLYTEEMLELLVWVSRCPTVNVLPDCPGYVIKPSVMQRIRDLVDALALDQTLQRPGKFPILEKQGIV